MRTHDIRDPRRRAFPRIRTAAALLAFVVLPGCDDLLTVENEQNILDTDLDTELAVNAVVNGVAGDLSWAYTYVAYMSSQLADEMVHSGSDTGIRRPSEGDTRSVHTWAGRAYDRVVMAAFTADNALERFTRVLGDSAGRNTAVARAHIYAGYVYLMAADNLCEITFNGGAAVAPDDVYPLAEKHFTDAMAVAQAASTPQLVEYATAGRARARVSMGDWAGAKADAQTIARGFEFLAVFSTNSARENNTLAQQTRKQFRKETGVRPDFYKVAERHNDPRTPFTTFDYKEFGADGVTLFVQQDKYPTLGAVMQLSSWQEVRLIEAEAEINLGDLERAVALINEVRADAKLTPFAGPLTQDAVFEQLIFERSQELWLEAQRLRDLRRTDHPFTQGRDICYPISITERNSNPNVR